ncbi:MAG: tRNA pseudouridine(55) synthase TruB [Chloroflexota bacterium]
MDGILNVCKPSGPTSHDIVAIVRRLSRQKRVGHAGTLDPAASGVLLLCLGKATRLLEYMANFDKEYYATIRFGFATDTYDATGQPTTAATEPSLSEGQIAAAMREFTGEQKQQPPAYSAIKVNGQPSYRLARADRAVPLASRVINIFAFDLLCWQSPFLLTRVSCSKGTYIRSIAHDLGQRLGVGAHLSGLVRSASGPFHLRGSVGLEELKQAAADGYAETFLQAPDEALLDYPALILGEESLLALRRGQRRQGPPAPPGQTVCRAYDLEGRLIAMLHQEETPGLWHPKKVLVVDN